MKNIKIKNTVFFSREKIKNIATLLLALLITFTYFNIPQKLKAEASEITTDEVTVEFSKTAGFYDSGFKLKLQAPEGYKIYYTTNGSAPEVRNSVTTKQYLEPLEIESKEGQSPVLARLLKANLKFNSEYRAIAVSSEGLVSKIYTNTYFIGILKESDKNMGVISLAGDPDEFMNSRNGVFNNPKQSNTSRAIVNVEYFDVKKNRIFSYDAETRVFGGFTRNFAQKSLMLDFDKGEESNRIKYPIFGNDSEDIFGKTVKSFDKLRLHTGGNDSKMTTFMDGMVMDLSSDMDIAVNPYVPVITFINGEYWGLYGLREDFKSDYFEKHFKVDADNVVAIKIIWGCDNVPTVTMGNDEDISFYNEM